MSVCLCDTTTNKDVYIGDVLVQNGLAIFSPDSDRDETVYDEYKQETCPQWVRDVGTHCYFIIIIIYAWDCHSDDL